MLQGLHRTWAPVIDLTTRLAAELGHPAQCNAYVTPPRSRGFSAHYDVHDVFVLQLAGRKHWTVHPPVHPDPLRNQPWNDHATAVRRRAAEEPALDLVLEAGDVLYLPRGWLHSAAAEDDVSAHLTVGVHVVTRYALVEALTALVADDADLRAVAAARPRRRRPGGARTARRHRAGGAARGAGPGARRGRRAEGAREGVAGRPPRAVAARRVGRLRRGPRARRRRTRPDRAALPAHPADALVLELPDRRVTFPDTAGAALEALLGGGTHVVGELPGMPEADQVVLVRRLLREGVVVPAARP